MNSTTFKSSSRYFIGLFCGLLLLPSVGIAGGALSLVTEDDQDIPQGTMIPKHRIDKIRAAVAKQKLNLKAPESVQSTPPPSSLD